MKNKKLLFCVIAAILVVAAVVAAILLISGKQNKTVQVALRFWGEEGVDLGKWDGEYNGSSDGHSGIFKIKDMNAFKTAFEESEFYDERLHVESERSDGVKEDYYCFANKGRLFSLTMYSDRVVLYAFREEIWKVFGSDVMVPIQASFYSYEDTENRYEKPGEWENEKVDMNFIKTLYGTLYASSSKIEDDAVYVKAFEMYEAEDDSLRYRDLENYAVKIYEDENGKVLLDLIFPEKDGKDR